MITQKFLGCFLALFAALVCSQSQAVATASASVGGITYTLTDLDSEDGIAAALLPGEPASDLFLSSACVARDIMSPCKWSLDHSHGSRVINENGTASAQAGGYSSSTLLGSRVNASSVVQGDGLALAVFGEEIVPATSRAIANIDPGDASPLMLTPHTAITIQASVNLFSEITNDTYQYGPLWEKMWSIGEHASASATLILGRDSQTFGVAVGDRAGSKSFSEIVSETVRNDTDSILPLRFYFRVEVATDSMFSAPAAPVPEPATLILAFVGLLGLALKSRRFSRHRTAISSVN